MRLRATMLALLGAFVLVATGCAGKEEPGRVPDSARLAPRDAIAFVSIVTDESSGQWQRADRLFDVFPDVRRTVVGELERELEADGLSWDEDVAPALGPEVVIVVTADRKVVGLTQPDDRAAFERLLRASDEPSVTAEVSGWTAFAEDQADIDAYRAALARGSIENVSSFRAAFEALPPESIAVGWTDIEAVGKALADAFGGAVKDTEVGVRDLAAALSAEDDGVLLSVGVRLPEGTGDTTYEPALLERVPGDSVLAFSFGGTQGALDRVERTIDLEGISGAVNDLLGVSFDNLLEALSGEGVLYVRDSGGELPEVTLVLDPPNADKTWQTIEDIARKVADESGGRIDTTTQGGRSVNRLVVEDVAVLYTRLDGGDTLLVTTGPRAIDEFTGGGAKLADDEDFERAAQRVDLGERTSGFAYVDLDGLIPFVERLGGPDALPTEGRDALSALDSFILQTDRSGDATRLQGFLRTTR